ncbi:hypothetical protein [Desulfosarcina ovata]|nr:hypothetical protein [Desulfosarcina ovata]
MKPLFLPLKKEHYNMFERGLKQCEYRKYGPRWNERTCVPGRPAVISCGYRKGNRLFGYVAGFATAHPSESAGGAVYLDTYGMCDDGPVAEIYIAVRHVIGEYACPCCGSTGHYSVTPSMQCIAALKQRI